MELIVISLLSGAIGASILNTLYVPQIIPLPVPKIAISPSNVPARDNSLPSLPSELALSEAQKEQVAKVNWEVNFRIYEILTIEQQKEFKTSLDRGLRPSTALNSISISREQKNELLSVFRSAQKQIEKILTPEQLDYIQQQQQNRNHNPQPSNFKFKLEEKKYDVILHLTPRTTT